MGQINTSTTQCEKNPTKKTKSTGKYRLEEVVALENQSSFFFHFGISSSSSVDLSGLKIKLTLDLIHIGV